MKQHARYMKHALTEARKNMKTFHGGPFGACIVKNGRVIAISRNTVLKHDATCHAEVNAIRSASKKLKTFDLSGCVIYSTAEPCPMCFSAIHWARIDTVYYGASIADAKKAGFNEITLSNHEIKRRGKSPVKIGPRVLPNECKQLFNEWVKLPQKRVY